MFLSIGSRGIKNDIPFGSIVAFAQATVPIGWQRVTTFDDAMIRIVGATTPSNGGVNGFSVVMAQTGTGTGTTGTGTTGTGTSGGTALTTATMPAHTHTVTDTNNAVNIANAGPCCTPIQNMTNTSANTSNTGSGTAHTHSIPGLSIPALSVPSLSLTMNMKFVDAMLGRRV